MKRIITTFLLTLTLSALSFAQRETILFNNGWRFSLGNAASMQADFTHGTEYFTYLTKAVGQNQGPASTAFDDSSWRQVNLPHDWVVDLPYEGTASHSHGYKQVGWAYPENSVGWYRKTFKVNAEDEGKAIEIVFDGIFRDAEVFCNGFYLGHELSGYATQAYRLDEYLNYGGDNVITVRCDASTEEGWYYEGAGIYRNVHLVKKNAENFIDDVFYVWDGSKLSVKTRLGGAENRYLSGLKAGNRRVQPEVRHILYAADGSVAGSSAGQSGSAPSDGQESSWGETIRAEVTFGQASGPSSYADGEEVSGLSNGSETAASCSGNSCAEAVEIALSGEPVLWDLENPYLYTLRTELWMGRTLVDAIETKAGLRTIEFNTEEGFLLNGKPVELVGANLHLDHAGVGSAVPDELGLYRVRKLKDLGMNAIRMSHNPATPALLDVCDSLGMLVIDENRLMGVNKEHLDLLERMIVRDRNHPSVILWSIGNEEWWIESDVKGEKIARTMIDFARGIDSSRPYTYGNSGGFGLTKQVDIHGYNYIVQNDVLGRRETYPDWVIVGTEETSGCGTRNVYQTDSTRGWMLSINREGEARSDGEKNVIERGWKFYRDNPWAAGLFYWTGFDYRGEPNPMKWPATGSQFGILDYCGFPKDEAFYLKAAWTEEPVLHIFPHWNLKGMEGQKVEIWAYSNCDEVRLRQDGRSLGRKKMPKDGHLVWETEYKPGKLTADGYRNGKRVITTIIETTGEAVSAAYEISKTELLADGQDVAVIDITLLDEKGRYVPDACPELKISLGEGVEILGWGNGDPAFKTQERPAEPHCRESVIPAFMGNAQVIVRSLEAENPQAKVTVSAKVKLAQ